MLYIANYGTAISQAALNAINSFVALGDTPAGQHLAKVAGAFANTPDTGGGGGSPGGSSGQVQYNNGGAFGGITGQTTNGTNTTFAANTLFIADQTDATKLAVFDASGISAATTRTLTIPNATDTLAVLALSQTFSNKTLGNTNVITSRDDRFTLQASGDTTKQVVFSLAGLTTVTTRTITVPDANGTMTLLGNTSTGSGAVVLATSPTLVTPVLGVATATSINGNTFTTGTYTLTGAAGKTLTFNNTITIAGTDATVMTFPTTSKTIAANDGSNWTIPSQAIGDLAYATSTTAYGRLAAVATGQVLVSAGTGTAPAYSANPSVTTIELGSGGATDTTLSRAAAGDLAVEGVSVLTTSNTKTVTNKRVQPRTASSTTSSNLSPDLSTANVYYRTTQTATLTIDAPIGTPVIGETIMIYVDSAGAQTLTINSTYKAFGAAFPSTTTAGKTFMMSAQYNGTDWKTLWANAV